VQILIVEDNDLDAELLRTSLTHFGYQVDVACNGQQAFSKIRSGQYRLVISDWEMPGMNGLELCRQIRHRAGRYIYIILLTSRTGTDSVVQGLNAGADDFIPKPFHPQELCVRVRVGERILALASRDVTIFSLAKLAESRDPETGSHLERMREYCRVLAEILMDHEALGEIIDGEYVEMIYLTSPLHDIGKVGIPDRVLLKPGRLTPEEFEIMKQHTVVGGQTLDAALQAHPEARFLQMARDIAWTHHERFDGTGYPCGLSGEDIPLCGRIAALADVYDALTTKRVYKDAYSHETARNIIVESRGTHFDPVIVDAFLRAEERFQAIHARFAEREPGGSAYHRYEKAAGPFALVGAIQQATSIG
jgi:putative two-component system response regulator